MNNWQDSHARDAELEAMKQERDEWKRANDYSITFANMVQDERDAAKQSYQAAESLIGYIAEAVGLPAQGSDYPAISNALRAQLEAKDTRIAALEDALREIGDLHPLSVSSVPTTESTMALIAGKALRGEVLRDTPVAQEPVKEEDDGR